LKEKEYAREKEIERARARERERAGAAALLPLAVDAFGIIVRREVCVRRCVLRRVFRILPRTRLLA